MSRRSWEFARPLRWAACLVMSAGCNIVFGTFEVEEGDAASGGGALEPCASPSTCETAPAGWEGPVALSGSEAECDGWQQALRVYEDDVDAEPLSCTGCSCGTASAPSCTVVLESHATTDCSAAHVDTTVPPNVCSAIDMNGAIAARATLVTVPGQCQPQSGMLDPPEVTLPPPKFVCISTGAGSCESGICVPPAARRCVMAAGELDCPQGYPSRHRLYESVNDGRSCGCTCGAPQGATCGGEIVTNSSQSCDGIVFDLAFGACEWLPETFGALYTPNPSAGSCEPSGGTPTGSIELLGVRTVCCDA